MGRPRVGCWSPQELLRNCYKWLQVTGAAGRFEEYNYVYIYIYNHIIIYILLMLLLLLLLLLFLLLLLWLLLFLSLLLLLFIIVVILILIHLYILQHLEALGKWLKHTSTFFLFPTFLPWEDQDIAGLGWPFQALTVDSWILPRKLRWRHQTFIAAGVGKCPILGILDITWKSSHYRPYT